MIAVFNTSAFGGGQDVKERDGWEMIRLYTCLGTVMRFVYLTTIAVIGRRLRRHLEGDRLKRLCGSSGERVEVLPRVCETL